MGLTHEQQMDILKQGVKEKYQGSYNELWQSADPENQQENVEVAETPQQQEQGLGGRAPQNMPDAMVFPQSQGDFNTTDMQAPIDIEKYGPQGDLVQSYKSVPPGIGNLPMGDDVGTVIERPAEYRTGGYRQKFQTEGVKDAKKGEPIMSYEELKKSLGVTELPSENYEAYLKNRSNFTGNTTISALSDKSYNKLSDPQKQVYDTFETPQGIAQTVDIGKGKLMHWENAMKMVEDTGVKNISNTPSAFSKMVSPGDFDKEVFRPHANPAMSNITIPSQQAHTNPYYDDMIAEISNLEYDPNLSKKDREAKVYKLLSQKYGYARKEYFEDLIAEVAHIPEFWRKESFINKPVSLAKDAYRFVTGQETDSARYKDPDHYEHATHGEFEKNLRKKYATKYQTTGLLDEKGQETGAPAITAEYFRGQEMLSGGEEITPDHFIHNFVNFVNTGSDEKLDAMGINGTGKAQAVRDALLYAQRQKMFRNSLKIDTQESPENEAVANIPEGFFKDVKVNTRKKGGFFRAK